ncbi:DNA methyltransferase [Planctomyces sp. SH-PL62]|uniref:DNA methyltransferase n=1 Tax=Planctomyces sp. SH-PL62 TaxID=1636152 RepID=UPI00078CE749|nr:DNA methyltransferase [Planctomyces sp. SH-PL62]AMV37218.1 DNA adenine methyltransferase YhdJ [Planctomyces sp. SH-PL62]
MNAFDSPSVLLGDCLAHLKGMASGVVGLAYLDPPFQTGRVHRLSARDRVTAYEFDDVWESPQAYESFLLARLVEVRRVLTETGSLFFHCGRDAGHVARGLLDRVFGPERFRSEIIWHYRRWSSGASSLLPAHQTIHYYTKTDSYVFNPIWEAYSPATNVDQLLQRRRRDASQKAIYDRDEEGRPVPSGPKRGVPLGDVWDLPYLNPKARERTGYPTQKPLALLERIIALASRPGDLVLDPFCGSGTTLVAAAALGRRAIGIDRSEPAVELARARLERPVRSRSRLLERGREAYRTADPVSLALLAGLDCAPVQRNGGIDAILKEPHDGLPVAVRVQRPGETAAEAAAKLRRAGASKRASRLILVVREPTEPGAAFEGVELIESPAAAITRRLGGGLGDPGPDSPGA